MGKLKVLIVDDSAIVRNIFTEVISRPALRSARPSFDHIDDHETSWRLIVAEDADDQLRAGRGSVHRTVLARLLNLADGVIGQGVNSLILLTTKATHAYTDFTFSTDDILLFGRESAGAPDFVHAAADARLTIPMAEGARSLNLALAAAMVAGEAMRQVGIGGSGRQ